MRNYSYYIDKLYTFGVSLGLTIDKFVFDLPKEYAGSINLKNKKIKMNVPNAKDALLTLAHAIGHFVAYKCYQGDDYIKAIPDNLKEYHAQEYGWDILEYIKVPKNWVNRAAWDKWSNK